MKFTAADIDAIKRDNSCAALAGEWVALRRKGRAGNFIGPCPFCSEDLQSRTAPRFECNSEKWVCAVCADGGDVIRLVARRNGLDDKKDFAAVLELLGGSRQAEDTPETAKRAGGAAYRAGKPMESQPVAWGDSLRLAYFVGWKAAAEQAAVNDRYRERERKSLYRNYWLNAKPFPETPVAEYLARRRLTVPANAPIRYLANCTLFADGKEREPVVAHKGPAMVCPIMGPDPLSTPAQLAAGEGYRFNGLHFTWIDLDQPKGKAIVRHPHTGEDLPSKKSRGSKQGGYIELGCADPRQARRIICGEGIENTLAAFTALAAAGRDLHATNFRCAIDLGNLAGKSIDRLQHPTQKTSAGRARSIPGPTPDLSSRAMPMPAGVTEIVWMCDGDSDPLTTRNAMARAAARHVRPGLTQRFAWPGEGLDWNDRVMS